MNSRNRKDDKKRGKRPEDSGKRQEDSSKRQEDSGKRQEESSSKTTNNENAEEQKAQRTPAITEGGRLEILEGLIDDSMEKSDAQSLLEKQIGGGRTRASPEGPGTTSNLNAEGRDTHKKPAIITEGGKLEILEDLINESMERSEAQSLLSKRMDTGAEGKEFQKSPAIAFRDSSYGILDSIVSETMEKNNAQEMLAQYIDAGKDEAAATYNRNLSKGRDGQKRPSITSQGKLPDFPRPSISEKDYLKPSRDDESSKNFQLFTESSSSSLLKAGRNWRKVLVLYTGGTIGMTKNSQGALAPQKGRFENLVRMYPQLHDYDAWKNSVTDPKFDRSFLILPENNDLKMRIYYKILEYDALLDSSNMSEEDWIRIAQDININYKEFDGFVVLHGTDTLPYTASALSFMFENIGKAVVITGSQIPIFEPRSDGAHNFLTSILIAGGFNIPEVTVYFGDKLFRGNRCRKLSANHLFAFDSPNSVPLVEVAITMEVNRNAIFYPTKIQKFNLHARMSRNVGLLRIFPSISTTVIRAFCQAPIEGVVLETYGAGNMPSNRKDIFDVIEEAVKRGVIVVNITQCINGSVSPLYEPGKILASLGVISGYDMTPEAALAKLCYVLSKDDLSLDEKKEMMSRNIRGELTTSTVREVDQSLADALNSSLNIQSPKKLREIVDKVNNALFLHAIEHNDKSALKKMLGMGADVNAENSDGTPPLQEAIIKGNVDIVQFLLENGASVHTKTRAGDTALMTAVFCENTQILHLLLKCGANLNSLEPKYVAETLANYAKTGAVGKLEALRIAGADLAMTDELGQTPLHKAIICNQIQAARYLWSLGMGNHVEDILGHSPLYYAKRLHRNEILAIILDV